MFKNHILNVSFFCLFVLFFLPYNVTSQNSNISEIVNGALNHLTNHTFVQYDFKYSSIDQNNKEHYSGQIKLTPNTKNSFGFDIATIAVRNKTGNSFQLAKVDNTIFFQNSKSNNTKYSPLHRLGSPLFNKNVKSSLLLYQYIPVLAQYENVNPTFGETTEIDDEVCQEVIFNIPQYEFNASFWIGVESNLIRKIVDKKKAIYLISNFKTSSVLNFGSSLDFTKNNLLEYSTGGPVINDMAPNWTLSNLLTDEIISLKDYRNKIVVIDFWATWCAPCLKAMPEIDNLAKEFRDLPVEFIGITYKEKGDPKQHVNSNKLSYTFLNGDESIGENYGLDSIGIPTVYIVDQSGKIVEFESGNQGIQSIERIRQTINTLLAND